MNNDFEFRKIETLLVRPKRLRRQPSRQTEQFSGAGLIASTAAVAEASINFEATVPALRRRHRARSTQRYGNYFDFFWRAKRDADVTVRLEYRQEKLRAFVQAHEIHYPNARGHHKT